MATAGRVTVTIEDKGYFRKAICLDTTINIKKVISWYRSWLCRGCSQKRNLELWYEISRLGDQTAESLDMQDGDIIDVRLREHCTRVACPLPSGQTVPNVHYLLEMQRQSSDEQIQESADAPQSAESITFTMEDSSQISLTVRLKKDAPLMKAMQAFAEYAFVDLDICRFTIDGERIFGDKVTPNDMEMEESDLIEVKYPMTGG